jgi:hypothetical protein
VFVIGLGIGAISLVLTGAFVYVAAGLKTDLFTVLCFIALMTPGRELLNVDPLSVVLLE